VALRVAELLRVPVIEAVIVLLGVAVGLLVTVLVGDTLADPEGDGDAVALGEPVADAVALALLVHDCEAVAVADRDGVVL
jgi:hypothetical protein